MTTETAPPLWTGEDARAATGAIPHGTPPARITGVSIDTRTLEPGDLFVAIVGETNDGHDYVAQAFAKGAAAALVAHDRAETLAGHGPLLAVEDTLRGLERLGRAARARTRAKIVAITGSVGKTGSKEALRLALSRSGRAHAAAASYNNHWGVPLTLARMPADTEFGIFEIGMNHAGEIAPLSRMVRPHVAIVTTVEAVHIENFRDIRGIADAKGEIFLGLEPGGVAVINRDNPFCERLTMLASASDAGRILTFGEDERADVRAVTIVTKPDLSIVDARVLGERLAYRIGMAGRHIALNSLALVAAAKALGVDVALSALALGDVDPPAGRGARKDLAVPGGTITLVDESYNANPASVRAALETLGQMELPWRGRRIAVLGDMLELGPDGPRQHREIAGVALSAGIDLVFTAGPLMKGLHGALPPERRGGWAETSDALAPTVLGALRPGDIVMIKGSRGVRTERIVKAIEERYSEAAAKTATPPAAAQAAGRG
ncbi:UDP-N-acetylmuramoylalanyl-D-glutamyl-2,6-diaminopimelate--D-alanyl-D-alanine ligase [Salinarimonas ramus]|uniref:UDP-N-acetylmuramoyl-tripeptide--D-alanyl-D-alanine ligase n=1 Tax=Salinarimonas ramus TaxID=690164 RepID=A0A917Q8P7_9HYPH|nr:UDP-N-acetylmuramoylalanyl-D-glutamyl-2,6-diaminopimelate--D-alanyl-D-alanine ligase [Salinarimonas ramus]GGK35742.1 UDP-N-acetylmuramoyl-tripeptide--D-alanyl-D-alanine ligase [Salinarimonas ramus]